MSDSKREKMSDQGRAFIEAAKSLGCDESEERFDDALKKVARHKPTGTKPEEPPHEKKRRDPSERS